MRIGIFLCYPPKTDYKKEGLGRYLAGLVMCFLKTDNEVSIACPGWSKDALEDLFIDYGVEPNKVNFVLSQKTTFLMKIAVWYLSRKETTSQSLLYVLFKQLKAKLTILNRTIKNILIKPLFASTMLLFILLCLIDFIIIVPLLPLFILYALFLAFKRIIIKLWCYSKDNYLGRLISRVRNAHESIVGHNKRGLMRDRILSIIFNNSLIITREWLVHMINIKYANKVDIWYSPSIFWPEFNKIKGVKAVNAPDLVTTVFPTICADNKFFADGLPACISTIENGKFFITYSKFLKESQLCMKFAKKPENVVAIPALQNVMNEYLDIDDFNLKNSFDSVEQKAFAIHILNSVRANSVYANEYIETFDFSETKYIFYASQWRPYKNILTLIKAYEVLLRKKYCNIKLFLTCRIVDDEAEKYVFDHRLQYDVLFFYSVSSQQLAALYKCAELVVNPTLYEGGFPWTFGEGMSVGTPSIMSDIPQVREVVNGWDLEDYIFDPDDHIALAEKIMFAIDHKQEAYGRQLPLYKHLISRTPEIIAQEYIEAFNFFINVEKQDIKQLKNNKADDI